MHDLVLYNYLSREKEMFTPLSSTVGMYVCGPTVYGAPHIGHARSAVVFDLLYRVLLFRNLKVRYVRNITDVGHLEEEELEIGDDKIVKAARTEQLEPMELVQKYLNLYRETYQALGNLAPSIEPHASGHIPEQIEIVQRILAKGYAYESRGSVYFDLQKYYKKFEYGRLSRKVMSELLSATREAEEGMEDKRSPHDFALWKHSDEKHLMQWNAPWGRGFPGWHLECTAMSTKYLGSEFDIHGGGMDLQFPHHEAEIAQSTILHESIPARYWIYNNMLTVEKKKMGKSLGNFITVSDLFAGRYAGIAKALDPMVLRFYFLRAHYRSVVDFSASALHASEEGLHKLFRIRAEAEKLQREDASWKDERPCHLIDEALEKIFDDLDTPGLIAKLFTLGTLFLDTSGGYSEEALAYAACMFIRICDELLGLRQDQAQNTDLSKSLLDIFLVMRKEARKKGDFALADRIREELRSLDIEIEDTKEGLQMIRYKR